MRVPPDCLYTLPRPRETALLFVFGRALPWRAYLARYGHAVPLVVLVGDPASDGCTEPSARALDGCHGWRQVSCRSVRARLEEAETAIYERVDSGGEDGSGGEAVGVT